MNENCCYLFPLLLLLFIGRTFSTTCSCDLFANKCDLNCCCDPDCSETEKKVFSSCITMNSDHLEEVCVSDDLLFSVNGKYQIQGTGGGLLCLYKNNYNARFFYADVSSVKTANAFEQLAAKYRKTSYEVKQDMSKNYENSFKVGDPLFILLSKNQQGFLPQPMSFLTNECDDSNPAQFLVSHRNDCFRVVKALKDQCSNSSNELSWSAQTYAKGYKLAPYPSFIFGEKRVKVQEKPINTSANVSTTPKPILTPIDETQLIKPNLEAISCHDSKGEKKECPSNHEKPSFDNETGICKNVVKRVVYKIQYENNVTVKIIGVSVILVLQDVSKTFMQSNSFQFVLKEDLSGNASNMSAPYHRSGNPGYIIGLPVVVGNIEGEGDGAVLYPSLTNNTVNFTSIVTTSKGICGKDHARADINFGVDLRTGCFMFVDNVMNLGKCEQLQQDIFQILLGKLPTHVASFGNPDPKKLSDWIPIIKDTLKSKPTLVNDECHNIYTSVNFENLFASTGFLKNPLRQIVGLRVKYGPTRNLVSQCFGLFCSQGEQTKVELVQSVSFVDVSLTPQAKVKTKPEFKSKAPHDFFYPFLT